MTDAPAAFQATVHSFRTVPTRKVVSITIEAPIEQHAAIALIAEHGAWVGVARLQSPPPVAAPAEVEKTHKKWADTEPTKQAGIKCNDPVFQQWVIERGFNEVPDDLEKNAACYVRKECGVNSRSSLSTNAGARAAWTSLHNRFLADMQAERLLR